MEANDQRIAEVNVEQVLAESLALLGFSLGERTEDFVRLQRADIPADCGIYFLLRNATPVYALRALTEVPVLIVVHVKNGVDDAQVNSSFGSLGLHALRLRSLAQLDAAALQMLIPPLIGVRAAVQEVASPALESVARDLQTRAEVDPLKVVDFAFTQADTLFEDATARIIAPMFEHVFPLGAAYRGKPVPDGIVVGELGYAGHVRFPVASYDCKSKRDDIFGFEPGEGDQQSRYLRIQERLERDAREFESSGVILFVPDASQADVDERVRKDIWRALVEGKRRLVVVPAKVLKRWWELQGLELPGQLPSILNKSHVWEALLNAALPDPEPVNVNETVKLRD
ncbi:hypothetical protein EJ065_5922 [Corallococcus coralloides]|uniref:Uncharacterized protein n=2 Tax=Corallococcus coralloides TaxID=184914 RepID=A0A410S003_CORCK|nr:hypothetical protein EJ065_5922 [Corallococcus coralloides]